jgi:hypothetical protein
VRQVHRIIKNPPCGGSGLFAAQRWPAFDAFVVVSFPIGKIGSDAKERFNIECEIRSVFEHNPDYVVVVHCRDFDSLNDFATDNSERVWFASLAGTGMLTLSQLRLLEWCERLGRVRCFNTERVRSLLITALDNRTQRKKSESDEKILGCVNYIYALTPLIPIDPQARLLQT